MSVRDLIPWGRSNHRAPSVYRDDDRSPFLSLHREMNRMFDDFFRDFDLRCRRIPKRSPKPGASRSATDSRLRPSNG